MQKNKDEFWARTVDGSLVKLRSDTLRSAKCEAWKGESVWVVSYDEAKVAYVVAYRLIGAKGKAGKWFVSVPFKLMPGHFQQFAAGV